MRKILVGSIIAVLLTMSLNSGAVAATAKWSWLVGVPEVIKNEHARVSIHPTCPTYKLMVTIKGIVEPQEICVFEGGSFRMGTVFLNGSMPRAVIKYRPDDSFRLVENMCEGAYWCVYSPETDSLFTQSGGAGVVFTDVSRRLHRNVDGVSGKTRDSFDQGDPGYVLGTGSGRGQRIGSAAYSENGIWLAYEIKDLGTARINIATGEKKLIEINGNQYGYGRDPLKEIAISNDGKQVAVMGENAGATVIVIDPECGSKIDDTVYESIVGESVRMCEQRGLDATVLTTAFYHAFRPKFSADGGRLTFFVSSFSEGVRRIVMQAKGYPKVPSIEYIALGDSFSSGEGETSDAFYREGTNSQSEKCHTSQRSYPFLLGILMRISSSKVKSVACSGAKTIDIISESSRYFGQGDRIGVKKSSNELLTIKADALESFVPGRVNQAAFIERYEPRLATIGIGGNDAGFMTKLKTCAMPGTCEWAQNDTSLAKTFEEIDALEDVLIGVYALLRSKSPMTQLFAVGYPDVITVDGECDVVTSMLLGKSERRFLQRGVAYINTIIRKATERVGIQFLDIEGSFVGARLCEPGSEKAVNGLRVGDDLSLSKHLPMLRVIGNETFHPTPYGHELISKTIHSVYGDLSSYSCATCRSMSDEDRPSRMYKESLISSQILGIQRHMTFAETERASSNNRFIKIIAPATSFRPFVDIEFRLGGSNTIIARMKSDSEGGATGVIEFPDVEEGLYSLHVSGDSFSSSSVEYYQLIEYGEGEVGGGGSTVIVNAENNSVDKNATTIFEGGNTHYIPRHAVLGSMDAYQSFHQEITPRNRGGTIVIFGLVVGGGVIVIALLAVYARKRYANTSQDKGG